MSDKKFFVYAALITGLFVAYLHFMSNFSPVHPTVNQRMKDTIYNKCISGLPLDNPDESTLDWIERCNKLSDSLALEPCIK